jgi:hypothetical protein
MAEMDDAENARAALRALWSMSGQMDSADSLGKEQDFSHVNVPTDPPAGASDGKGGEGGGFGSGRHGQLGFSAYQEGTHEPTFDRGQAATNFREAWKSQLAMDGKLGGKPLSESAAKTPMDTDSTSNSQEAVD